MSAEFPYDVFLSHSAKDKAMVRPLAERLRADGLKMWFGEWVLKPGDSIPAKIEAVLPHFTLRPLAFSLQPLPGAPLNQERCFIARRLDDDSPYYSESRFDFRITDSEIGANRRWPQP